ncbi:MAG: hypothetical protein ACJA1O_002725, partial [Spirosomataceae bacterium]
NRIKKLIYSFFNDVTVIGYYAESDAFFGIEIQKV